MKKYKIINTIIITFLLMLCGFYLKSQTYNNIIDFEHSGAYSTADNLPVDNHFFLLKYGISFHLYAPWGQIIPVISKVGFPQTAFWSDTKYFERCPDNKVLSQDDMPGLGQNCGCYFLTDDGIIHKPVKTLYIMYNRNDCSQASGYLIDLDVENFSVQAYDANNNIAQTVNLYPGMPGSGDGIATKWEINLGTGNYINYIKIIHTSSNNTTGYGGIAFDNFSFCSIDTNYSTNLCCDKFKISVQDTCDDKCCYRLYYDLSKRTCLFDSVVITTFNNDITVKYDCMTSYHGQTHLPTNQHIIQRGGSIFPFGIDNFLAELCAFPVNGGDVEIEVAFYATDGTICRDTVLLPCPKNPINCCEGLTVHNPVSIGNCCFRIDYDLFMPIIMPGNSNQCIFEEVIINSLNGKISVSNDVFGSSQNSCVSQYIVKQPGSNIRTGGNEFLADICTCPSNTGNVDIELIFRTTKGIECIDTVTLICPSTTPDICCNIDDLNISAPILNPRVRHYGSYYGIPINIPVSIPNSSIEEIRASIVSYNVNYSDPDCSRCYNSYIIQGTFRINNPGVFIGNLPMQSLSHYALGTNIGNNKNGVREIVWKGMPSILGRVDIPLEIMFPKPILPKCCDVTVKACIKLVFKDADCNICEEYICLEFDKNGIIH